MDDNRLPPEAIPICIAAHAMVDPFEALRAERQALSDLLAGLTPDEWNQASLCAGWRVRDVAAHAAMLVSVPRRRLIAGVVRFGGDVNRYMAATVPDRGNQAEAVLLADAQRLADSTTVPPRVRPVESALDAFVHQLDVALPLDRPVVSDPARLRWMADGMVACGGAIASRRRVSGLRLVATDIDWHYGTGPEVTGPAVALLLAGCGRAALDHELDGPGLTLLIGRR